MWLQHGPTNNALRRVLAVHSRLFGQQLERQGFGAQKGIPSAVELHNVLCEQTALGTCYLDCGHAG